MLVLVDEWKVLAIATFIVCELDDLEVVLRTSELKTRLLSYFFMNLTQRLFSYTFLFIATIFECNLVLIYAYDRYTLTWHSLVQANKSGLESYP